MAIVCRNRNRFDNVKDGTILLKEGFDIMKFEAKMMQELTLNENERKTINDMKKLLKEILSNFDDYVMIYNVDTQNFLDCSMLNSILAYIKEHFDNND